MDQHDRRASARKQVLQTFQVFIVIPKLGPQKIYLRDVSAGGLSFFSDLTAKVNNGDVLECLYYVNPSLHIPLDIVVAYATNAQVGCKFHDTTSRGYRTYLTFLKLLEELATFL